MIDPAPIQIETHPVKKSPTQRTLEYLRSLGYECDIAERRIPNMNITKDLFGIIDIIALTPHGVLGVQSTGKDFSGHWRKITVDRAVPAAKWLKTPGTSLMLIGWRKVKVGNEERRAARIKMIELSDLAGGLALKKRLDLLQ